MSITALALSVSLLALTQKQCAPLNSADDDELRPNAAALVAHDEDAGGEDGDDAAYRPLKRTAVPFEDDRKSAKEQRELERKKKRLQQSELLKDLTAEMSKKPEELRDELAGDDKLDQLDVRAQLAPADGWHAFLVVRVAACH